MTQAWDRQPGEPARWFARFEIYRLLGPKRSIDAAFKVAAEAEQLTAQRAGHVWYQSAKTWRWQERAEAYDAATRAQLLATDKDRRIDAREQRLGMIDQLLTAVFGVLSAANLDADVEPDTARAWLPTLRLMFKDLIAAQRLELGLPTDISATTELEPITIEDLQQAQQQIAAWEQEQNPWLPLRDCLATLYPDDPSARRIAAAAGLQLSRIQFGGGAINSWHALLTEAQHANRLPQLIAVALAEYPHNPHLQSAIATWRNHAA